MTIDLDALEKLADEATPGPWNDSGHSIDDFDAECMMRMEWIVNGTPADGEEDAINANYRADAAFIAAANPTTIKALIAEVRNLRARAARWEPSMITSTASSPCSAFLARNGKGEG